MNTWTRDGYTVVEVAFDHDLHQFEIVQDGETLFTITPPDLESQAEIINGLDAGEDVNGWEDGNGNTIHIEKKVDPPLEYVGAAWVANRLGTTQQNVSKSGLKMLEEGYKPRKSKIDLPRPDALFEGRPLWLKEKFV